MTSMIFSFDTEDFVTPESDDALLGLARLLTQHGLRGSFALVGDKVRALLARGRRDVIDACREHDIQYHSNNHMFHDMHNVKVRGVVPPKAEWRPPPFVGPAELRRRLAVFAGLVEFVGSRRDMEVITISDYLARHEEGLCWLSAAEVTALAQAIRRDFSYQEHAGGFLSAADVAGVLSHGLTHWREHHRLPDQTPVRRIVGPPEPALALAEARSATANELATACQQIESEIEARWRLPSAIAVGQPAAAPVPPATYLMAMADAVLRLAAGEPDAAIELAPQPALPRCKDELLAKVQVGAYVLPQDFNLGAIPTYTHLQSWSLRPAVEVR